MIAPTRRSLLGAAAALSAYRGNRAPAASAVPVPAIPADQPDAALLAACAEFDQLEHASIATFDPTRDFEEDNAEEQAMEERRDLICLAQRHLAGVMVELRATTLAGQIARARSLALWQGDDPSGDVNGEYINVRLLGAILRDLTEGSAAA